MGTNEAETQLDPRVVPKFASDLELAKFKTARELLLGDHILTGQVRTVDAVIAEYLSPGETAQVSPAVADAAIGGEGRELAEARAHEVLLQRIIDQGSAGVFDLVCAAQGAVHRTVRAGMPFDYDAADVVAAQLTAHADHLAAELECAMPGVNPASPKQLSSWIAEQLGETLAGWPRTSRGALGTDAKVLAANRDLLPDAARTAINSLLEHRQVAKRAAAVQGCLDHLDFVTGRIHSTLDLETTTTGRMASSEPNLQNVPRDSTIRALFCPGDGRALVIADFGQIELRVVALLAQEPGLLEAFAEGLDVHSQTAAMLLGKAVDDVTRSERQLAKALNFGLLYGQGAKGLQAYAARTYGVDLTPVQADGYRQRWFDLYNQIPRFHQAMNDQWRRTGVVRTPCGRVCRPKSFTEAINYPVQGGAAEVMLAALARVDALLEDAGLDARVVLVVHDEIIVEVAESDAAETLRLVTFGMQKGMGILFPSASMKGLVEAKICRSWGDK